MNPRLPLDRTKLNPPTEKNIERQHPPQPKKTQPPNKTIYIIRSKPSWIFEFFSLKSSLVTPETSAFEYSDILFKGKSCLCSVKLQ